MSDGMRDYWRARRQYEQEQKVMKGLLEFLQKLLRKKDD